MTAQDIINLLATKHSEDVFVSECKDGPSQNGSHVRLDAWAMPRSWTRASVRGYEVKISRSDFKGDQKWHHYLPLCNQLYFVCPSDLIAPAEMPESVGLLWASKTGTRLYEKKKAAFRDVAIPENLFRYILMCRTVVARDNYLSRQELDRSSFWSEWLKKKASDRLLGHAVGGAWSKQLRDEVAKMEHELRVANAKMAQYDKIRAAMTRLGLDPDHPNAWSIDRRVSELAAAVPDSLMVTVVRAREAIGVLETNLDKIRKKHAPVAPEVGA